MQRIAERIQKEFATAGDYIEINALDGNGGKSFLFND
jgi:hypothetical protein